MAGDINGYSSLLPQRIKHGWREETTYRTDPDAVAGGDSTATQIGGFSGTTAVMTAHATSAYTGTGDRFYKFTVSGAGTVGTTVGLLLYYDDGIGHADYTGVAIGSTYTPGAAITIAEGIKVALTAALVEAASAWEMGFSDNAISNSAAGDAGDVRQIGGTAATTSVLAEDVTSAYSPTAKRTYLFAVSEAGTVGTTVGLNLLWDDQNGNDGTVAIGSTYTPGAALTIGAEGVVVDMTAGAVEADSEWSIHFGALYNEWFGEVVNVNYPIPIYTWLEDWVNGQGRDRYSLASGMATQAGSVPYKVQDFRTAVLALGAVTHTAGDGSLVVDPLGTVIPVGYNMHEIEVTYDIPSFTWDMEIQYGASPTRKIGRALGCVVNTLRLSGSVSEKVEGELGIMAGHFNDVGIGSSAMSYSATSPAALRQKIPYIVGHAAFYLGIDRTGAATAPLALAKVTSFDYTLSGNMEEGRYTDANCSSDHTQEMLPGHTTHDLTLNITPSDTSFWEIVKRRGRDKTSSGYPNGGVYTKCIIKLQRSTYDYAILEFENCGINVPWTIPESGKVTIPMSLKPESCKITEVNDYAAASYPTGL